MVKCNGGIANFQHKFDLSSLAPRREGEVDAPMGQGRVRITQYWYAAWGDKAWYAALGRFLGTQLRYAGLVRSSGTQYWYTTPVSAGRFLFGREACCTEGRSGGRFLLWSRARLPSATPLWYAVLVHYASLSRPFSLLVARPAGLKDGQGGRFLLWARARLPSGTQFLVRSSGAQYWYTTPALVGRLLFGRGLPS